MTRQLRILGAGWEERRPDVVFVSIEHIGLRVDPVSRLDLSAVDALRLARGLISAVQRLEEQRAVEVKP